MSTIDTIPAEIAQARAHLAAHPLYAQLNTTERVRVFMSLHVFAVWDFFSLLKRLQREVSCVEVPWRPRKLGDHARFITEIVLAEECDETPGAAHVSHFELYLQAMEEAGADRAPILAVIAALERGSSVEDALATPEVPPAARAFTAHTMKVALDGSPHEVAAAFCHGRENLLPDVLSAAQAGLGDSAGELPTFAYYLQRHITLDHDEHGPLALRLLDALCDGRADRHADATRVGLEAIKARSELWDGILEQITHDG
jgi:hypothetical protein